MTITPALVRPTRCSRAMRVSARASYSRRALRWAALRFRRSPGGAGRSSRRCGLYAEILGSFRSSTGASHRNACVAAIITPSLGRLGWL